MVKTIIFKLVFYLWTAIVVIFGLPFLCFSKNYGFKVARIWGKGTLFWIKLICGVTYKVNYLKELPKGSFIIASRHQSAWEIMAFFVIFERPAFVLKRQLMQIPLFNIYLKKLLSIAVNRDGSIKDLKNLSKGAEIIKKNNCQLVIFS